MVMLSKLDLLELQSLTLQNYQVTDFPVILKLAEWFLITILKTLVSAAF